MLLIVTHRRGFEADVVIDALRARSHAFLRFNADDPQSRIAVFPDNPGRSWLECDGRRVALADLTAGWFQQDAPNPALDDTCGSGDRLAWLNKSAALEFVLGQADIAWLSKPDAVRSASNKLRQLSSASRHGLRIPATVVTDSKSVAVSVDRGRGSIVKNLASPWLSGVGGIALAYTRDFSGEEVSEEQVSYAPLIYQERLRRRRDIRVVVVGDDLFAAAINSGDGADIRTVALKDADYRPYNVEHDVEEALMRICADLRLGYASIDLVEDVDGRIYFLEINTTGAFLWLERICGLPITSAIVGRLAGLSL